MEIQRKQYLAILKLRFQLLKQNWLIIAIRVVFPIIFGVLLVISRHEEETSLLTKEISQLKLPKCFVIDSEDGPYGYGAMHEELNRKCKSLGIFPKSEYTEELAEKLLENNELSEDDLIYFDNENDYLDSEYLNITELVVGIPSKENVLLYYNYTKLDPDLYQLYMRDDYGSQVEGSFSSIPLRLELQVTRAMSQVDGKEFNITIKQIPPGINYSDARIPNPFITTIALIFLSIIQLLAVIEQQVEDKEGKVLGQLRLLGCIDSQYLLATYTFEMLVWAVQISEFIIIVKAVPNYSYFSFIDTMSLILYFLFLGLAVTSFAFFVASFTDSVKIGIFIGVVYAAVEISSFLIFSIMTADHFYDKTFLPPFVGFLVQMMFPMFPQLIILQQMYSFINAKPGIDSKDLSQIIVGNYWYPKQFSKYKPTNTCMKVTSLSCSFESEPAVSPLLILVAEALEYFVFAWWLYEFIDSNYSLRRSIVKIFKQRKQLKGDNNFAYASLMRKRCTNDEAEYVIDENPQADVLTKEHIRETLISPNDPQNVLEIHSLHKTFDQFEAVKSVSLKVKRSECLALLGKNGTGKSTTINMLIGALHPDEPDSKSLNQAYINGFNVRTESQIIREQIGVCPEFSILFSSLTPVQHLTLAQNLRNIDKKDISRNCEIILKAVQLWNRKDDAISTFSGGMKRRVSIAMSLVNDNELVFLDEPTGSLDPECKRVIWNAIQYIEHASRKFHKNNTFECSYSPGILITTHDMIEAEEISNNIAIMNEGAIAAYGNALELLEKYSSDCGFLVTCLDLELFMQKIREYNDLNNNVLELYPLSSNLFRCEFKERDQRLPIMKFLDEIRDQKIIYNYIIEEQTLEQVFLNITQKENNDDEEMTFNRTTDYHPIKSMIKKLVFQDFQSILTLVGYIILPIGLLLLCLFVAELFVPWMISMMSATVNNIRTQAQPACTLCKILFPEESYQCSGFDPYENIKLCTFLDKLNEKEIKIPDFQVGGYQFYSREQMYQTPLSIGIIDDQNISSLEAIEQANYSIISNHTIMDIYQAHIKEKYDENQNLFPFNYIEIKNGDEYYLESDILIHHYNSSELWDIIEREIFLEREGGIKNESIVVNDEQTLNAVRQLVFSEIPVAYIYNHTNAVELYTYLPYSYPEKPYKSLGQKILLNYSWISDVEDNLGINLSEFSFYSPKKTESIANQAIPQIIDFESLYPSKKSVGVLNDVIARMYNYQNHEEAKFTFKTRPYKFVLFIAQAQDRAKVLIALFFLLLTFFSIMPVLMFNVVLDKQSNIKKIFRSLDIKSWQYWVVNIVYEFIISTVVHFILFLISKYIFHLSIYSRIENGIEMVLLVESIFTQVSMSVFLSLFFSQTAVSLLVGYLIVILVSLIVLVFGKFEEAKARPWFFISPLLLFASSFLMVGSGGYSIKYLPRTSAFQLVLWDIIESMALIIITPFIDYLLQPGEFKQFVAKIRNTKPNIHYFQSSFNSTLEQPIELIRPIDSKLEINSIPKKVKLGNDHHSLAIINDIIEENVMKERCLIQQGVSVDSLFSANLEKVYQKQIAVRDISMHFENEEIVGIVGNSGAGKSTDVADVRAKEEVLRLPAGRLLHCIANDPPALPDLRADKRVRPGPDRATREAAGPAGQAGREGAAALRRDEKADEPRDSANVKNEFHFHGREGDHLRARAREGPPVGGAHPQGNRVLRARARRRGRIHHAAEQRSLPEQGQAVRPVLPAAERFQAGNHTGRRAGAERAGHDAFRAPRADLRPRRHEREVAAHVRQRVRAGKAAVQALRGPGLHARVRRSLQLRRRHPYLRRPAAGPRRRPRAQPDRHVRRRHVRERQLQHGARALRREHTAVRRPVAHTGRLLAGGRQRNGVPVGHREQHVHSQQHRRQASDLVRERDPGGWHVRDVLQGRGLRPAAAVTFGQALKNSGMLRSQYILSSPCVSCRPGYAKRQLKMSATQLQDLQTELFTMELTANERDNQSQSVEQQTLTASKQQELPLQAFLQRCEQRQLALQTENLQLQQKISDVQADMSKKAEQYKKDTECLEKELTLAESECKEKNSAYKQIFRQYDRDMEVLQLELEKLEFELSELKERPTAIDILNMIRQTKEALNE